MISKKTAIQLRAKLVKWNKAYHTQDQPLVSDQRYDQVLRQLSEYEIFHPEFKTAGSPTQIVGGPLRNKFTKFVHPHKMYSLANAFNVADLVNFDAQIHRVLHTNKPVLYAVEEKIDGISVALHYKKGFLHRGVTRGNGTIGEDITTNLYQVNGIPHWINYTLPLEVRGEVYMAKQVLRRLNKGGAKFANPRNAAGGTLRQLQPQVVKQRGLNAFFYSIPNFFAHKLNKQTEVLPFLKKLNFCVNPNYKKCASIQAVVKTIPDFAERRSELPYNIDGVVVKVDDLHLHEEIGYTSKFPKAMIAFKFPAPTGETTLLKIFATVGRTGKITYNAELAPLNLDNTVLRFATLHNAQYVKTLGANVGDKVKIQKAGDIIPQVTQVLQKINPKLWVPNFVCPSCETKLVRRNQSVDQFCPNELCSGKQLAAFTHFTSRNAMNIVGLGGKTIQKLLSHKFLTSFPSVFELPNHKAALCQLPGFNKKSVDNLCVEIHKAHHRSLARFLFALGINHVGERLARTLALRFGSLEKIKSASLAELVAVRDLGVVVAQSVRQYFGDVKNQKVLVALKNLGVHFEPVDKIQSDKLKNMTFVITGVFESPRVTLTQLLQTNGANITTAVSSRTTHLLCGTNPGSKLQQARKHNVKIIGMKELTILLKAK